jgi:hypothetical protein
LHLQLAMCPGSEKVEHKFDPIEWLRAASVEESQAALPGIRAAREKWRVTETNSLKGLSMRFSSSLDHQ